MKKLKCPYCSENWYVEDNDLDKQSICPFCLKILREKVEFLKYDSIGKAIYGAVDRMGKDILNDSHQLLSFMMDIAPGLRKELHIFSRVITNEYLIYIKKAFEQNTEITKAIINKLHHMFIEEEGLSDDWADILCVGISDAVLFTRGIGISSVLKAEVTNYYIESNVRKKLNKLLLEPNQPNNIITRTIQKSCRTYNATAFAQKLRKGNQSIASQDFDTALEQFQQVANIGYVPAYGFVADIYFKKKKYKKAWKWYLKLAELGNAIGEYNVGYFYLEGLYVKKIHIWL